MRGVSPIAVSRVRSFWAAACALGALLSAGSARADGAFPDSQSIMTPDVLPNEIVLATNFGLVVSPDSGQTWTLTCESTQSANGGFYQMGPAPRNRIFTVSLAGLAYTDDNGCTWNVAGGAPAGSTVQDAFVDQGNLDRVLSIVTVPGDGGSTYQVFETTDGGATLGTLRYTFAASERVSGIEVARSASSTLYATINSGSPIVPKLAQSTNDGASWMVHDLSAMLGAGVTSIRLIAVDPTNPNKVFMRVASGQGLAAGERIALTTDGGATITTPLVLDGGVLGAFFRLPNGHIIAGGVLGSMPAAYISTDGGMSFQALPTPPHLKAMSSRGGTVYAVGDNMADSHAIFTTTDEGMSWQPLMSYDQIAAIATCVMQMCQADCLMRAQMDQWSVDFCSAVAPPPADGGAPRPDGSSGGTTGQPDAHGSPDASADGGHPVTPSNGCHCDAGSGEALAFWPVGLLALGGALALRRRRPRA